MKCIKTLDYQKCFAKNMCHTCSILRIELLPILSNIDFFLSSVIPIYYTEIRKFHSAVLFFMQICTHTVRLSNFQSVES
jgi:hypothetical protein